MQRVYLGAGRKGVGESIERIALVVVDDGIGKVDGIGRVGFSKIGILFSLPPCDGLFFCRPAEFILAPLSDVLYRGSFSGRNREGFRPAVR